jgi:hypothetical protein
MFHIDLSHGSIETKLRLTLLWRQGIHRLFDKRPDVLYHFC